MGKITGRPAVLAALQAMVLVVYAPELVAADEGRGEIILGASGTGGLSWYWEWEGDAARWWTDYRLTDKYGSGRSRVFYRELEQAVWINCPEHEDPRGYNVAWGRYSFRFCLVEGKGQVREWGFGLDLTDPRWALQQPPYPFPVDLYVRALWNGDTVTFEYQARERRWGELPGEATIWELWGVSEPGPDVVGVFEPTVPLNFVCTNAGQDHQHPHFRWDSPQPDGAVYWYNVYRRRPSQSWRRVASDLSDTAWTDQEVFINRQGVEYLYCATDYTSRWPESGYSNTAKMSCFFAPTVVYLKCSRENRRDRSFPLRA